MALHEEQSVAEQVRQTIYFDEPGPANTERVLQIAQQRAKELSIHHIVVASTRGATAAQALRHFPGPSLVAVTHVTGAREPDTQELTAENRRLLEQAGVRIVTATHALGGAGRAVRKKLNTGQADEIIAYTLRLLGEGMKVVVEISLMAADAGLVRTDEEVIAIAGTSQGADTAVVLRPANTHNLFELRVLEVLCKPRL
jgi:hypothetical protein